jgi:peptide/nickel transport system permease protein
MPRLKPVRRIRFWVGVGFLAVLILGAVSSLFFRDLVFAQDIEGRLLPPSGSHWLGTDSLGRDVLARILGGLLVSLEIAFVAVLIGCVLGVLIGAVSGYYGGLLDTLLMRLTDAVLAVPVVLLAISVIAVIGGGLVNLIAVIAVTQWPMPELRGVRR